MTTKEELINLITNDGSFPVLDQEDVLLLTDAILSKYICIKKADCEVVEINYYLDCKFRQRQCYCLLTNKNEICKDCTRKVLIVKSKGDEKCLSGISKGD